jgi:TDG/mug DNA glycosylase family protein
MPERLRPLLDLGLSVVFVGTEPGETSLREQHYYADPSNRFYADLHAVGFTPRRLESAEDAELLQYGIGLDDVYNSPDKLRRRIERATPQAVCFNSKEALKRFTRRITIPSHRWRGAGARRYAVLADVTWAVDDSSGRCGHHETRIEFLLLLKEELREARPT